MQTSQSTPTLSVRRIVITGILSAIAILLGITRLGFIPVPNLTGNATILHVPVVIGAIIEGPLVGTLIGLIFGVSSLLQATNPFFADPLVAVLPRLFIGVAAWAAYAAVRPMSEYIALIAAAVAGTLTNTILVVGMIVIRGYAPIEIFWTVAPQALAEVVIAAVITVAVVAAWKNIEGGRRGSSI